MVSLVKYPSTSSTSQHIDDGRVETLEGSNTPPLRVVSLKRKKTEAVGTNRKQCNVFALWEK